MVTRIDVSDSEEEDEETQLNVPQIEEEEVEETQLNVPQIEEEEVEEDQRLAESSRVGFRSNPNHSTKYRSKTQSFEDTKFKSLFSIFNQIQIFQRFDRYLVKNQS